ncbi:hypothetical protein DFR70_101335 [Nocardia tenerifensis]|uniref:Uncharacterized protein n=1 Tax=Nocardia tenerifensis TaxID=228006 RepID=A0A318KYJ1_9NOCA|nr:hypothetical protein [Nocardia tenerifensis]PXX70914.1 hypothetical protein DFR70_101335 [Nocardia tenerifensis]
MSVLAVWLRATAYALWAPPLAVGPVASRLRVPRRLLGESIIPRDRLTVRAVWHSVLGGALGVLTWFLAFLAVLAAVRGIFYPLLNDHYENSWGGPTLAGAWTVHALLGVGLLPAWLLLLAALGVLQVRLTRALLGRAGPRWPVPAAVLLCAGGVLLFVAWLHQL